MNIYLIKQYVKKTGQWQVVAVIYNNLRIAVCVCDNFIVNYPLNRFKVEKVGCKI